MCAKCADRSEDKVNDKENKYIFDDDENDDFEIAEYLERELDDMETREINRTRKKGKESKLPKASDDIMTNEQSYISKSSDKSAETNNKSGRNTSQTKKTKFVLYYENSKLKVLWCMLGVLIVILLVALIVTNIGKSSDSKENKNETKNVSQEPTTEETATEEATTENAFLAEPADSPYIQVCTTFLKSTYVEWNDETLSQICDNTQNLSKDNYSYLNKYIEDIENVNCYVGYETEDGKVLVFVTYNMKFANISTTAPAMEAVVLVKAQEGDVYFIHNFEVGDEVDLYTSNVQNNQNYLDLCSNINAQLDAALESDADLKKVYEALKNAGGQQ